METGAEYSERVAQLSQDELLDLARIQTDSPAEAMYLEDALADVGIPTSTRAEGGPFQNARLKPEVCVPRKLIAEASAVVARARDEAKKRGIEQAFEFENVEDAQLDRDPVMMRMFDLGSLPASQRNEKLSAYIAQWILDGRPERDVARYLAAAGLEQDEAAELIAAAVRHQSDHIEHERGDSYLIGWLLLLAGFLVTAGSIWFLILGRRNAIFYIGGAVALAGLVCLHRSSHNKAPDLSRTPKPSPPEEPPTM